MNPVQEVPRAVFAVLEKFGRHEQASASEVERPVYPNNTFTEAPLSIPLHPPVVFRNISEECLPCWIDARTYAAVSITGRVLPSTNGARPWTVSSGISPSTAPVSMPRTFPSARGVRPHRRQQRHRLSCPHGVAARPPCRLCLQRPATCGYAHDPGLGVAAARGRARQQGATATHDTADGECDLTSGPAVAQHQATLPATADLAAQIVGLVARVGTDPHLIEGPRTAAAEQ